VPLQALEPVLRLELELEVELELELELEPGRVQPRVPQQQER
jgi:hypothetical protein